ncbi:hypothetical protein Tco_0593711 [Tanacetum coccineum]
MAPGRYPIDVEPIPPRLKKNREVHLHYIERLKENVVETLREIVEDAKVERPLDTSLASACRYTKHSQELSEYVIGTCPKDLSPRDKQNASTTSLRKKGGTFLEPCETLTYNTPAQVEHQKINSTNAHGIPSIGVKGTSAACRSKPRSNTKKDRTFPAKSALKQVEAHSRMNKSNGKQKNRVDSSISYKRTVINSNSNTSCKTCNKCLISVNHDQCVVRSEMFVKQSPATKVWRVKQVWKATGKLFTTIGHQWRPTGRLLPLGDQWPLTRNTPPKVLPTKQWKPTGRLLPLGRQCPLVRSTALKSDCMPADPQETIAPVVQIVLWYLDSGCSKHMTGDRSRLRNFVKKFIGTVRFGNDHFGAIMGYGDYVIGDSVISRIPTTHAAHAPVNPTGPLVSISFDQDAPSGSHLTSSSDHQSSSVHPGIVAEHSSEVNPFAAADSEPFVNVFAPDLNSEASSSGVIMITEPNQSTQPHEHLRKWTVSHPIDNIIGNPSRPVSTRKQLATDALW